MTTRELYVYYRVDPAQVEAACSAVASLQRSLVEDHRGLTARCLRKEDATQGVSTWMEIYTAPHGIAPTLQAEIERRAHALSGLLQGLRHVEVFLTPLR